jgi:addiction module HigA family antidote
MRRVHPGEILFEEFLKPMKLSATALARALRIPPNRVTALINETRGVTAETAMLLGAYFGTTPAFWLNLQQAFDLQGASQDKLLIARVKKLASGRHRSKAA